MSSAARSVAATVVAGGVLALAGVGLVSWFRAAGVPTLDAPLWARWATAAYLGASAALALAVGRAALGAALSRASQHRRDGPVAALAVWALIGAWSGHGLWVLARGGELETALGWSSPALDAGRVEARGDALLVSGTVGRRMAEGVRDALAADPGRFTRLVLDSPGGSVGFGDRIARLVQRNGLATEAPRRCSSACLDIFLAAEQRIASDRTRLGCHQRSYALTGEAAGPSEAYVSLIPPPGRELELAEVIARCDATPPWRIYEPPVSQLIDLGAVTHLRLRSGVVVPAQAQAEAGSAS